MWSGKIGARAELLASIHFVRNRGKERRRKKKKKMKKKGVHFDNTGSGHSSMVKRRTRYGKLRSRVRVPVGAAGETSDVS